MIFFVNNFFANMRLSFVSITYDNLKGLSKTLDSYKRFLGFESDWSFEFVVVDGGSEDGTVEYIRKNEIYIDAYLSEADDGIYHAMQ